MQSAYANFLRRLLLLIAIVSITCPGISAAADIDVLFLGDNGHHQPRARYAQLQPVLFDRGIRMVYSDDPRDLDAKILSTYDAVVLYANIDRIEPEQAQALLTFVAEGGGFVPLHCATYCFRNSDEVVALMGGQFLRHGTGTFRTEIAQPDHEIMRGFGGFESWDETYVHHLHNEKNRTVLAYRVDETGREPWTWVRHHGNGRVFYTAWGHDHRTWSHPGFQNLVERGIRWVVRDQQRVPDYFGDRPFPVPEMTPRSADLKPFEYIDVGNKIPNYPPSRQWGVQLEPLSKMQKPLPAEESMKHIQVPRGFRVELFASEPMIGGKPIAMAWDERGRLWVAETYDYPNELQPPGQGRDRVRILEDTDGDWRADKATVFADKLSIPTTLTFYRGGIILQDGTQTLYLKDNDGDDVADQRDVLFTGWSQGDTHGGVSNFQYGFDNWIWAMQGYNNSSPAIDGEVQQRFQQGFFRFRPDGSQIEFVRSTNNNTWGLGISEEGIIFGSTANRNPSVYMPIPNRYYERVRGWTRQLRLGTIADTHLFQPVTDKIRQVDQHGGYTAAAGHALYTARRYPPEYWNRTAFVNGPTGHLVGTFVLRPRGADFESTSPFNLFASHDEWTAPIMSEVGPDGNVWVIDWYNYIVQHNPTPRGFKTGKGNAYETELRDKKHGRIYRVVYGDAAKSFSLAGASTDQLIETLGHSNLLWRRHAQRLLVERGEVDIVPQLIAKLNSPKLDALGLDTSAIHALWVLHGLGLLAGDDANVNAAVIAALRHPSAGVRRNALQVLPPISAASAAVLENNLLGDRDPQVQLAAALALSDLPPHSDAGAALLAAMNRAARNHDTWLQDAIISAAATHADSFLAAIAVSRESHEPPTLDAMSVIANHYGRSGPVDSIGGLIAQLASAEPATADAIFRGVASGWPVDRKPQLTEEIEAHLQTLLERIPVGSRGLVLKLARHWGSQRFESYIQQVTQSLLNVIDDDDASSAQRIKAARDLVEFRSLESEVVALLLDRVSPQTPPELASGFVAATAASVAPEAGRVLTDDYQLLTPTTRTAAIGVLLSRPASTGHLLTAIDRGTISLTDLTLEQRQSLRDHPNQAIRERARALLARGGALASPDRQKVMEQLLPITKLKGDPVAGKQVFIKNCAACHMHGGEGKRIGPDLTGMAVHPKAELLTHIIDPNRDVEGNYRIYAVETADGRILNGLLASESKTAIELYDAEGKMHVILREDIEFLRGSNKSLMPVGFEKQIDRQGLTNLLEFLTTRGRFLPLDMRKAATIASDRGMFFNKDAEVERLIFPDWTPKTFQGVPFHLIDPQGGRVRNVVLLHGPNGPVSAEMPRLAVLPFGKSARALHLLSGVSGWGFPYGDDKSVSLIVRLRYVDGTVEDHPLRNGVHFADYIRRHDVPASKFAFALRGQQIRYLAIFPQKRTDIQQIEFVKGEDRTAPVVMAVTAEQ